MHILEINHGSGEIHRYFLLPGEEYTVGRKECRILLPNAEAQPSISRHHATLTVSAIPTYAAMDPKVQVDIVLRDFSKHGTFVDRERVGRDNVRFIYPEDRIRFGLRVTARVLPVTLPLIVSPNMEQKSLEVLLDAAVLIGAVVMEDHVPAPADFYQKHINCVGFLFVSDDKFTMDAAMMEALGLGYTLVTTGYVVSLAREIKANDRLMPSEFSVPIPPIPASLALRSVHYRRPVQTFYSPLEFLSVGSPVVSTVFENYTMLIAEERLQQTITEVVEMFGGVAEKVDGQDLARYRTIAASNPQALAILTEATFNRVSELVIARGGSKGDLAPAADDDEAVAAGLLLYRCGICIIPEENIELALYRDDPRELRDKTGACYLQRTREDVEADASLVASPTPAAPVTTASGEVAVPTSTPQQAVPGKTEDAVPPSTSSTAGRAPQQTGVVDANPTASTPSTATSYEPVRRRSRSGGNGPRPTQITVHLADESASPEGSIARAEPEASTAIAASDRTSVSRSRSSAGSANGRGSSNLPPKTGGTASSTAAASPPSTAVAPQAPQPDATKEDGTQQEPTSAHSIGPDDDDKDDIEQNGIMKGAADPATTAAPGKSAVSTTAPTRTSAIPPRHQPLTSAVAINRRVAERRLSLGGTSMDASNFASPSSTAAASGAAGKSPSNRLPPKNVVTGGASARKTPTPAMDASSSAPTPTRRLPASSAPPVSHIRTNPIEPLETPNNLAEDDDGHCSGCQADKRPVVLHAAAQFGHSPIRQRVEPVKITNTHSDRRYSLPRGSAGPEDESVADRGTRSRHQSSHADPFSSDVPARSGSSAEVGATSAARTAGQSSGSASGRVKRQAVRRESVANRASVTRRAAQKVSYQRSDSSCNRPLESVSSRTSARTTGTGPSSSASAPRSGRASRTGHHPHSLVSPVPVRDLLTATAVGAGGGGMGSMSELPPAPTQTSARRRLSDSLMDSNGSGLPPQVPHTGASAAATGGRAASVMPISNSTLSEGYHADAQLGLQCESFSKSFLQGFTSGTEKVSRTVLRQTYMDSTSKQFFEGGLTRLGAFLEYMHQHEKEIAPMYSTEATRRSCYDIRQNATYVLRKIKGTFDSVKAKSPSCLQQCRDVLNSRQRSPTRLQQRYNSVSGHISDAPYRRPARH